MSQASTSRRRALAFLAVGALLAALIMAFAPAALAAGTTVLVDNLQPSWTAPGGGGVYSAYVGPTAYDYVSPGATAVYSGREAGIIKAGINIDSTSGHYEDEGLFAVIPNVAIESLAPLTYDVVNQEGTNPVWMTIELDTGAVGVRSDNTTYQHVPSSNPAGWHTVDAAAGLWQKWNNGDGDVTGNPLVSLADIATAHPGVSVIRAYLRLGMGDSYHGTGNGTVGWVDKLSVATVTYDFVVPTRWYVSKDGADANEGTLASPFLTIQKAVDSAAIGDTIHVADGTYVEQVTVTGKSLTIDGNGAATVIQAPDTVPACFAVSGADRKPVVCAKGGANLTLTDVTIDGAGKGNANYGFLGVAFNNAGGEISRAIIKDIRDTPFSGGQHGVGAYSYNDDGVSRTIKLLDSTIVGFQKNATAFVANDTTPLVLDIERNTITGAGVTATTAQNGIQTSAKSGSGVIANNTISGIAYGGSGWVATAILDFYTNLNIHHNTLTTCHTCIYTIDTPATVANNTLTVIKAAGYSYGIVVSDPPAAKPSPYDLPSAGAAKVAGAASVEAVESVTVSNNTLTFSGSDNVNSVGIEADAGYGAADLAPVMTGNTVTGFNYAVGVWQCDPAYSTCTSAKFASATVNNNNLAGNTIGLDSNATGITVNAENNWWGSACGPATGYVSGPVDYNPWWLTSTGAAVTPTPITSGMSASDQCAQINSAASGTTLTYGAGTYPGGVVVAANNVTIDLGGATVGHGSPAYTILGNDVTLQNGILDGGSSASADPAVLVQPGANNFTLSKVEVKNWADGVQVAGAVTSLKIVNNYIHNNTDAGLQVDGAVAGVQTVEGNLFKANGGDAVKSVAALKAQWNSFASTACPTTLTNVDATNCTFAETFIDVDPTTAGDQFVRNVDESTSFDVKVMIDAKNLYGYAFKFSYDSAKLLKNSANPIVPAGYACLALTGLAANEVGYQCSVNTTGASAITGLTPVMVVNFTATGSGLTGNGPWDALFDVSETASTAGTANGALVYLNNVKLAGVANARDITDVAPADDGKIVIRGIAQYTGFIDVQGRADDSGALLKVFPTSALAGTELANATSAKGGAYTTAYTSGNLLTIGTTYYFLVDKPLYVRTVVSPAGSVPNKALATRSLTSLNQLVLKGGDADNSEDVGLTDATCIGGFYGASGGLCGTTGSADVNGDGKVDILDLTLMGGNYGIASSTWTP